MRYGKVPYNLKSTVTKTSRYESELNNSFAAFAEQYNTHVFPTRVYKPKDKALVEGAVKIIYTTIFTKIDEKVYLGLEALNKDIGIYLEAHNNTLLTGCDYSRRQQFDELEKKSSLCITGPRWGLIASTILSVFMSAILVKRNTYKTSNTWHPGMGILQNGTRKSLWPTRHRLTRWQQITSKMH